MPIFRLGDTSARTKNQLNPNLMIFEKIYSENELNSKDIYNFLYNDGYKRKPIPSKITDVDLFMKTLKRLDLVKNNGNIYNITNIGTNFGDSVFKFNLDSNQKDFLKFIGFDLSSYAFLNAFLNMSISKAAGFIELEADYSPFSSLLNQIITSKDIISYEWFKNWMMTSTKSNNKITNNYKNLTLNKYSFRKKPTNFILFKELIDSIYSKNINQFIMVINKFSKTNFKSRDKIYEILRYLICKSCNLKMSYYNKKNLFFKYINSNINTVWQNINLINNFDEYILMIIDEITIDNEYFDINKRWIEDLNLGTFVNKNLHINKNLQIFLLEINKKENFSDNKIGKDIFKYLLDKEFLISFLNNNPILKEKENNSPYELEKCLEVINKYNDYIVNKTINRESFENFIINDLNIDPTIGFPTIIEYFTSLFIWHLLKKNNKIISDIKNSLNTALDSDLKPIRFATGGQPDAQIILENKIYTVETTTLVNSKEMFKNETLSILEHGYLIWDKYQKDIEVLLFSPFMDENFKNLLNSIYNTELEKTKNEGNIYKIIYRNYMDLKLKTFEELIKFKHQVLL
ncbi:AlwI family type II restriction endonuclease [Spiroplasma gladiatoris]|uniref:AlwI family type II restriction endonuclease n=1 Tax=Spiroplasma gladiatoris TaxID=2143 RepID=A0A4P7AHA2_9MOLU|nr:hypothetical protein [Spiroplasma gladiatoris]QBQ07815.1 AlwI family type II restriction endonuclease [Spiroplasma gladiatoris]